MSTLAVHTCERPPPAMASNNGRPLPCSIELSLYYLHMSNAWDLAGVNVLTPVTAVDGQLEREPSRVKARQRSSQNTTVLRASSYIVHPVVDLTSICQDASHHFEQVYLHAPQTDRRAMDDRVLWWA